MGTPATPFDAMPHLSKRKVNSPWLICVAARDDMRTLVFSAVARDHTGLLLSMVELISNFDNAFQIDEAHSIIVEDFFTAFLLVRAPETDPLKIDQLVTRVQEFATKPVEGYQIPVVKGISMTITGPNRPGLLKDVCRLLHEHDVHIAQFDGEQQVELKSQVDLLEALRVDANCELKFQLRLPAEGVQKLDQLRTALGGLGLKVD